MSQFGAEEQRGVKAKQHEGDDATGHFFAEDAQPTQQDDADSEGHMLIADKAAVFSAQDDEDDTEGHKRADW